MKKILLGLLSVVFIFSLSCGNKSGDEGMSQSFDKERPAPAPAVAAKAVMMEESPKPGYSGSEVGGGDTEQVVQLAANRKIIYTGEFRIEVKSYDQGFETMKGIVEKVGGFIEDSHVDIASDGSKSGYVRIRIPSDKFNEVMFGLKGVGKVKYQAEKGNDVTEEYTDLETRLANSKRMEARLLDLLEKETKSVKDLLDVEVELGRVRENIETMEGRKRFLGDRISLSIITIDLFEPYIYSSSIFDPIKDAFNSAGDLLMSSIGAVIKFIAAVIPWLVIILVIVWIGFKIVRRIIRKRKQPSE